MGQICGKEDIPSKYRIITPSNVEFMLKGTNLDRVCRRELITGTYKARVKHVDDATTMTLVLSTDGITFESINITLEGITCAKPRETTLAEGTEAMNETLRFLGAGGLIGMPTRMQEWFNVNPSFVSVEFVPIVEPTGRYFARVYRNARSLGEHLVRRGLTQNA
jgi:hypothetical protein